MSNQLQRLLVIMATLRDPMRGCDWDRAQRFETIVPHTIEEAYEVADAVARGDIDDIREELGDLLFQVVFQARIAEELGFFDFDAVARSIADKLEARHPHIFGDAQAPADDREARWEALKASERSDKGATSALDGVAAALPALMRADKLQKRAARVGFDWPDREGPAEKLAEEMAELAAAPADERVEEAGDLLFTAVNVVRAYGVAPEDALRAANAKFERRFRAMEKMAGSDFAARSLKEQEALWQAVKAAERS
ncbi:nucleoside triphosphate pyrophosphohydrolase [Tsuneonella amylolytica]|uniref:nucleoside triphosphate pyrophosphohydrolase n=1 Tax=Tsuneonella amylolytica TaxID=2338327 RepID=UPI000EAA4694|nr:nucleoside triphosphate pyrophosphohydrolase [Tsuneonella amylolytica]